MSAAARGIIPQTVRENPAPRPSPLEVFTARAEARAALWQCGELTLHEAIDQLQADAVRNGLVAELGQDAVQRLMAEAFAAVRNLTDDLAVPNGTEESPQSTEDDGLAVPNGTRGDPLLEGLKICADTKRQGMFGQLSGQLSEHHLPPAPRPAWSTSCAREWETKKRAARDNDDAAVRNLTGTDDDWSAPGWREAAADYHEARAGQTLIAETEPERLARLRELLADEVSLELNTTEGVAASTLMAAEYLVQQNDAERLQRWLDRHSAQERQAIQKHLGGKHAAKPRTDR